MVSKASEWAFGLNNLRKRVRQVECDEVPRFFRNDGSGIPAAYADTDGSAFFERTSGRWSPEDALALAHWILDTFGEPEAEPRP